jgi:hypothetical protein
VGAQLKQVLATLKGAQGTLGVYAAQVQPEESRFAFQEAVETLGSIVADLEERLQKLEFEEPQYKGN